MLGLTRSLAPRLVAPLSVQMTSVRHHKLYYEDGEIIEYRIAPPTPNTKNYVGPYPRTKEEREMAAKKYNLIPEDYEPYPEDEGLGDYPMLKAVGEYNRDQYDDYDDMTEFRFYGEPLHRDFDLFKWERLDPLENEKPRVLPDWKLRLLLGFGIPIAGFFLVDRKVYENNLAFNPPYKLRNRHPEQPLYTFPYSENDGTGPHLSSHH